MAFDQAYFDAGICRIGTECEKWDGMIAVTGDECRCAARRMQCLAQMHDGDGRSHGKTRGQP